ncbi:hypothetical protein RvY_13222-1 [Ramazzottius varieornatus]|uniref:Uncharacterized protein n=1 Tax=Ramazzottius varieornatus TaxID=947166 RepID=A0A1D1VPD0_RAMVA|nr:hypothetical protein RvY_13222-1 [Ramazzottius varieornatus]
MLLDGNSCRRARCFWPPFPCSQSTPTSSSCRVIRIGHSRRAVTVISSWKNQVEIFSPFLDISVTCFAGIVYRLHLSEYKSGHLHRLVVVCHFTKFFPILPHIATRFS